MKKRLVISTSEFEEVLRTTLSPALHEQLHNANLEYEELTDKERDAYLLKVIDTLLSNTLPSAGEHRQAEWEKGWEENLAALKRGGGIDLLIPRYHGKHTLLHWRRRIIRPLVPFFDYHIHCLIVDWAIQSFLSKMDHIYEFGCGPAYHLLRARRYNPNAHLVGLDWTRTSQRIILEILALGIERNLEGRYFNFYEPDYSLEFPPHSGIITIAALEQTAERFEPFLQFLLKKKPMVCVHLEPIDELMDQNHLIDRFSVLYCRKRNYLNGFLSRLRELEEKGILKIHRAQRTYTGSFFIEGHSLVVWSSL